MNAKKAKKATIATTGAIAFLATISLAAPQNPPSESRPEFDIASFKPMPKDAPAAVMSGDLDHGKVTLSHASLRQIIGVAYSIQRVRVEGGPAWLDTELYQIVAKSDNPNTAEDRLRLMLQSLLEERCRLKVHRETRLLPVYTLLAGRGGAKLSEAKDE